MKHTILHAALLLCLASPVQAAGTISGRAEVVDGNTVAIEGQKDHIRLFGIDAPEKAQTCRNAFGLRYRCGSRAATALAQIIGRNGALTCTEQDRDAAGRIVAVCMKGEQDVGGELVREGWARDYDHHGHGRYASLQAAAEAAKRGAWAGHWTAPWKWRETQQAKAGN